MNVPQSCSINASSVVEFDFGNISAQSYLQAGAGQKPAGVNILEKSVGIACNDISAQSTMTLRLEAGNVSGNVVVSDNSGMGFMVANASGAPLTANNSGSVIPLGWMKVAKPISYLNPGPSASLAISLPPGR